MIAIPHTILDVTLYSDRNSKDAVRLDDIEYTARTYILYLLNNVGPAGQQGWTRQELKAIDRAHDAFSIVGVDVILDDADWNVIKPHLENLKIPSQHVYRQLLAVVDAAAPHTLQGAS